MWFPSPQWIRNNNNNNKKIEKLLEIEGGGKNDFIQFIPLSVNGLVDNNKGEKEKLISILRGYMCPRQTSSLSMMTLG